MRVPVLLAAFLFVYPTSDARAQTAKVAILVDLDPARVDRSVQIESITADSNGRLYVPDGVTGNILRIDPSAPTPVVVGRIAAREGVNMQVGANGLAFDARGDLYIAKLAFDEVLRIRKEDLDPAKPGMAMTFAKGVTAANGIAFDRHGYAFVSGTATGRVYRISPAGAVTIVGELGTVETVAANGSVVRAPGTNGVAVDGSGAVYVTHTSRGEIWKFDVLSDSSVGKPILWVKTPLIERVDGIAFDAGGTAWLALQRNAIVTVSPKGEAREIASNDSSGPLQAPTGIVLVGSKAYVNNYDNLPPPNGDGKTSENGIGSSIAVIER